LQWVFVLHLSATLWRVHANAITTCTKLSWWYHSQTWSCISWPSTYSTKSTTLGLGFESTSLEYASVSQRKSALCSFLVFFEQVSNILVGSNRPYRWPYQATLSITLFQQHEHSIRPICIVLNTSAKHLDLYCCYYYHRRCCRHCLILHPSNRLLHIAIDRSTSHSPYTALHQRRHNGQSPWSPSDHSDSLE
jgi:hypothetical protein